MSRLSKAAEEFANSEFVEAGYKIMDLYDAGQIDANSALVALKAMEFMLASKGHYLILRQMKISAAGLLAGLAFGLFIRFLFSLS